MYLEVFVDEAAPDIDGQIQATKELGRKYIEARSIDWANIHDIPDAKLEEAIDRLEDSGVQINCFDSILANCLKSVTDSFVITLEEIKCIMPRIQQLVSKLIRVMNYAVHSGLSTDGKFPKIVMMKKWTDAGPKYDYILLSKRMLYRFCVLHPLDDIANFLLQWQGTCACCQQIGADNNARMEFDYK